MALIAVCASACGGRLSLNENPAQEGGAALADASLGAADAGSSPLDATLASDTSSPDAAVVSSASPCWASMSACHTCPPGDCNLGTPSGCGGLVFLRLDDFLAYFSDLAQQNMLVVPQHGVDCTSGPNLCSYDPRQLQASASDIHYSNPDHEFIGPDGRSYIWLYYAAANMWLVGTQAQEPALYAFLQEWIECIPGGVPLPDGG